MVTRSKKPEADVAPAKASKPKAAARPKAALSKKAAVKAAPKKAAPKKATPKGVTPKGTTPKGAASKKAAAKKTEQEMMVLEVGRKIGDMLYNDELLEALAEIVLLGKGGVSEDSLPEIKRQLFDYDIYMVSFLTDEEIGAIAIGLGNEALKPLLIAIRDNARLFVSIAANYNSVRAFIDRMIEAESLEKLKAALTEGELQLSEVGPEHVERYLLLF